MKLKFLCAKHRKWLTEQTDQAINCCANSSKKGRHLYHQGRWKEALPYLGCAFESAEILLTTHSILPTTALEFYLHTLSNLTQVLKRLELVDGCNEIYQNAIECLIQEALNNTPMKTAIDVQVALLKDELRQLKRPEQEQPMSMPMPQFTLKNKAIIFH